MKIVVLAGGKSDEHDVSMSSGSEISNALIAKGHQVLLMDLLTGIKDQSNFDMAFEKYQKSHYAFTVSENVPKITKQTVPEIGENVLEICSTADIVFLALHGGIGENGQLQAIFDAYNIKYTGSGYQGSLLAMNKIVSKEIISNHGIHTANWVVVSDLEDISTIQLPAVVKPIDNGSSIGIDIVETETALKAALVQALNHSKSSHILVEEKIEGREFSVGILGEQVLPVIELIPKAGFYDYKNKYQQGKTEEIVPAKIDQSLTKQLQATAWKVHQLLGLSVYSRIDFLVDNQQTIFVIEANSLPGMTPTSLLPQEAASDGMSYEALCEEIVNKSLKNYRS